MKSSAIEFNQEKLTDISPYKDLRILNNGCGAVGSYAVEYLAKMGIGNTITLCDRDDYHKDNGAKTSCLVRFPEDNERPKSIALAERAGEICVDSCKVNYINGSVENLGPLFFAQYDYVFASPDSVAVREYVNQQIMKLPPELRPIYIFGGTDLEMGLAGRADTTKSCYRCYCEEDSFRSSKKTHSCNDIRYRYNSDGSTSTVRVSNLSSAKAAILMADELRSHVKQTNLGIDAKNRLRVWNPDTPVPMFPGEIKRRADCPDCNSIRYPESIDYVCDTVLTTTLRDFFSAVEQTLGHADFELDAHRHSFGEEDFTAFVTQNFCRRCGAAVDVYRHSGRITSSILCDKCKADNIVLPDVVNDGIVETLYGFKNGQCDSRLLDMTLFDIGFPIGAYLFVTCMNGALDLTDPRVERYCFACRNDESLVSKNIDFMKGDTSYVG